MNTAAPTVYVVDDDAAVLKAVSRLLRAAGFHVATFSSPHRFLHQYDSKVPGCLVLDVAMPDLDGLQLQQMLADAGQTLPIVFLTGNADVPASVKAMKQGAVDLLTKPVERDELLKSIRAALAKDQAIRLTHKELAEIRSRLSTLTPREYEVFGHVIGGRLNKQIAADIGAAEKTVKIHRARMMDKMKVKSVAELVRLAEHAQIGPSLPNC
jgi:FixJ family two-component response regulator